MQSLHSNPENLQPSVPQQNIEANNPASNLRGRILNGRWLVKTKIDKTSGGTGGNYSIRYLVEDVKTGQQAFLKALNYKAFFARGKDKDPVKIITEQNSAFEYERDVLLRCKGKNLSKVTMLYDTGVEYLDDHPFPVPFLVFEMADGDLRSKIEFSNLLDLGWKLKSLHNVAVGIKQLHAAGIGHQDLKPSNVLLYDDGDVSKIGDLGNSLCTEIKAPHQNPAGIFTGDSDYMPIEFFYRHIEPDMTTRIRATDMYLFGGLTCFYFTGLNMTSLIYRNTDKQFRANNWTGSYSSVRDYLLPGFYKAIKEFRKSIEDNEVGDALAKMIEYTCFPYPNKRGHPRSLELKGCQYDFHRIIQELEILYRKVELKLLRHGH
jgi:serine/threonine protein kinase